MLPRSRWACLSALAFAFLLTVRMACADDTCVPDAPPMVAADRAVSLRQLEYELSDCQSHGACSEASLTWYGITRVGGYVVDIAHQDIILYGSTDPGLPPLRVEDFAVALRNAMHLYVTDDGEKLIYSDPAVSIDPDPPVMQELDRIISRANGSDDLQARDRALDAWCSTCALPQRVRVEGIPRVRFSALMVSADYLLKRLVDGSAKAGGLESLGHARMSDAIKQTRERQHVSSPIGMNRFWFYPGSNLYLEDPTGVELVRSDVVLLDEAEQITPGGHIIAADRVDPLARAFACAFSHNFPALIAAGSPYPIFAELEALFRWSALARILSGGTAFQAAAYRPEFLIDHFHVPEVEVPRVLNGIASVKVWDEVSIDGRAQLRISLRLPSCGGVSMVFDRKTLQATPDTAGALPRMSNAVIRTRPVPEATNWPVLEK